MDLDSRPPALSQPLRCLNRTLTSREPGLRLGELGQRQETKPPIVENGPVTTLLVGTGYFWNFGKYNK
jgi:hypothetical protein